MTSQHVLEPPVSIVIPSYNRRSSLERLLDALAQQTCGNSEFEVIVVDDGSTDGSIEAVRERQSLYALRVITQQHAGPAEARNRGVADAQGALILFLDDDVVPRSSLIQEHLAAHAATANAVVIGPMSPPGDWPRPIWVRWEEDKLDKQYRDMVNGKWKPTGRQFYTGNASLTRSRFMQSGGFDTHFKRAEDVELGYRLADAGAQFVFDPHAEVLHYAWRSFESWCSTPYQYGRNDVIMQRDKGRKTLDWAIEEFHDRNALNRGVVLVCAARPRLVGVVVRLLGYFVRLAARLGARKPADKALSAIFNLLYWQGVCDEVGDRSTVWRAIAASGSVA